MEMFELFSCAEFSCVDCERKCCISQVMLLILAGISGFSAVEDSFLHNSVQYHKEKTLNEGIGSSSIS